MIYSTHHCAITIVLWQAILYVDMASAGIAQNTELSASASALSKTAISAGFQPVVSYEAMRVCKIIYIFLLLFLCTKPLYELI